MLRYAMELKSCLTVPYNSGNATDLKVFRKVILIERIIVIQLYVEVH